MDCLIDGKYANLIIEGTPTEEQLTERWIALYSEYCEISGSDSTRALIMQMWERTCLETKIISIKALLKSILQSPSDEILGCLAMWGYNLPQYTGDDDVWEQVLQRTQAQIKGLEFQLSQMDALLNGLRSGKSARKDFTAQLVQVSKHTKFQLRVSELSTLEYALYVKDYVDYCERQNQIADAGLN